MSDDEFDFELAGRLIGPVVFGTLCRIDAYDLETRRIWCREHDDYMPRVAVDGDEAVVSWGGRPLAFVPLSVLQNPDARLRFEALPDVPDDISELAP